jgi:hypothetical protein
MSELLDTFAESLPESAASRFSYRVLYPDQEPRAKALTKVPVLVVVGHKTLDNLIKNDILSDGHNVFLLDSPVFCSNYRNIELLDVVSKTRSFKFVFRPLEVSDIVTALKSPGASIDTVRDKVDIIPHLLADTPASALHYIQTFLYSVPDVDKRSRWSHDLFLSIEKGTPFKDLDWFKPTNQKHRAFLEWSESEEGQKILAALHSAVNIASRSTADLKRLEREYGVSRFDIRYSLLTIRKAKAFRSVEKDTREMYNERKHTIVKKGSKK